MQPQCSPQLSDRHIASGRTETHRLFRTEAKVSELDKASSPKTTGKAPSNISEVIKTLTAYQKQSNSQRSSVSSSSSPKSIVSDSIAPTAPSCRAHYAVEKRYRTTLNDRYAALARLVSQTETQEICRTENKDWEVPPKLDSSPSSGDDKGPCKRQSKTTTLSAAIDTIALLDRCCMRKAQELQSLREQYRALSAAGN